MLNSFAGMFFSFIKSSEAISSIQHNSESLKIHKSRQLYNISRQFI